MLDWEEPELSDEVRERLIAVRDVIVQHPESFAMEMYVASSREAAKMPDWDGPSLRAYELTRARVLSCGTVCCIAGWYHVLTPLQERSVSVPDTFEYALGTAPADRLAHVSEWPAYFEKQYEEAHGNAALEAAAAAARIDHFLATGE